MFWPGAKKLAYMDRARISNSMEFNCRQPIRSGSLAQMPIPNVQAYSQRDFGNRRRHQD